MLCRHKFLRIWVHRLKACRFPTNHQYTDRECKFFFMAQHERPLVSFVSLCVKPLTHTTLVAHLFVSTWVFWVLVRAGSDLHLQRPCSLSVFSKICPVLTNQFQRLKASASYSIFLPCKVTVHAAFLTQIQLSGKIRFSVEDFQGWLLGRKCLFRVVDIIELGALVETLSTSLWRENRNRALKRPRTRNSKGWASETCFFRLCYHLLKFLEPLK